MLKPLAAVRSREEKVEERSIMIGHVHPKTKKIHDGRHYSSSDHVASDVMKF